MTDRDVVARAGELLGVSVYALPVKPNRKPAYRVAASGAGAVEWMRRLYPWLGARRRAKIDEILAEYEARESASVQRRRSCSEAAAKRPRVDGRFVKADV